MLLIKSKNKNINLKNSNNIKKNRWSKPVLFPEKHSLYNFLIKKEVVECTVCFFPLNLPDCVMNNVAQSSPEQSSVLSQD